MDEDRIEQSDIVNSDDSAEELWYGFCHSYLCPAVAVSASFPRCIVTLCMADMA